MTIRAIGARNAVERAGLVVELGVEHGAQRRGCGVLGFDSEYGVVVGRYGVVGLDEYADEVYSSGVDE